MTHGAMKLSRRTILRGVGVTMALPWLESTGLRAEAVATATAADPPPRRLAILFMGNGISPNHWWAKDQGVDMELSKSLQPLAAFAPV